MSVMASEGSNAVCSYQAARGPVQRDRPQRPALSRSLRSPGSPGSVALLASQGRFTAGE